MWSNIVRGVQLAYGDILPTPEEWAEKHGTDKACPDKIIAAAIVRSFATNYADWDLCRWDYTVVSRGKRGPIHDYAWINWTPNKDWTPKPTNVDDLPHKKIGIKNDKKEIIFEVRAKGAWSGSRNVYTWTFYVNDVEIEERLGEYVLKEFMKLYRRDAAVRAAQAEAKRALEHNEQKWQLAERLLNMKRNDQGALVPVLEIDNDSEDEFETTELVFNEPEFGLSIRQRPTRSIK